MPVDFDAALATAFHDYAAFYKARGFIRRLGFGTQPAIANIDLANPIVQATSLAFRGGRAVLPRPERGNWHLSSDAAASLVALLLRPRFPAFLSRIGPARGTPIDLCGDTDHGVLSRPRFAAAFGPAGACDIDAAFEHTLAWLGRHPRIGPREGAPS